MSTKVSKLIDRIRDTLSDPDKDRWENDRLIRAINEAMLDINKQAKVLRSKAYSTLQAGVSTYDLGNEIQLITRVLHDGKSLPFKTHAEMDEISDTWEEDIGNEIKYIVYDHLNRGQIKVYPILESDIEVIDPVYGVVVEVTDVALSSVYGVLVDIYEPKGDLILYFIKKPTEVDELEDEIELDDTWDKALKHYVCGSVLRDDKDAQNRTFGNEEIQLYGVELKVAKRVSSENFTRGVALETGYRSI